MRNLIGTTIVFVLIGSAAAQAQEIRQSTWAAGPTTPTQDPTTQLNDHAAFFSATLVQHDAVAGSLVINANESGELISSVFDVGVARGLGTITAQFTPAAANIELYVRAGASVGETTAAAWMGPIAIGSDVPITPFQFVQYRVVATAGGDGPIQIDEIAIAFDTDDDGVADADDDCPSQVAGCFIDSVCVAEGTANPQNPCQRCDAAMSTSAFSPAPQGTTCDDTLTCTNTDVCDGTGACMGTVASGCAIEGMCVEANVRPENDECRACIPAESTTDWTYSPTAACDTDTDGVPDLDEDRNDNGNPADDDTDQDSTPNYQDTDDDGDHIATVDEDLNDNDNPADDDTDSDTIPNYLDADDDNDGVLTVDEDANQNGTPVDDDLDNDDTPDYLDADASPLDSDADGVPDLVECPSGQTPDTDADGMRDCLDDDDDGDGVPTRDERPAGNRDTDSDGKSDHLDSDDDSDGIPTAQERAEDTSDQDDLDTDSEPSYLDPDSDGDSIPDSEEGYSDPDRDGKPNYLDTDSDGDGISDLLEGVEDEDGDGTPDFLDVGTGGPSGGGGCSVAKTTNPNFELILLGLLALGLIWRRRQRSTWLKKTAMGAGAFVLLLGSFALQASAQVNRLTLDAYRSAETADDGFAISRPTDLGSGRFGFVLSGDYARNPLVWENDVGSSSDEEVIVENHLVGSLTLAVGIADRLVLYAGLPVSALMDGNDVGGLPGDDGASIGDVFLGLRLRLFGEKDDAFAMAVQATGTAPTAKAADDSIVYAGDESFTAHPELLAELRAGRLFWLTANVGARFRKAARLASLEVNDELTYGLGLTIPVVRDRFHLHAEAFGATTLEDFGKRESSPLEILGGFKVHSDPGWTVGLAGGTGLQHGYGSPDVRAVAMIGLGNSRAEVAPPPPPPPPPPVGDSDGDGLKDDVDQCPSKPEDRDGFEDQNGCPDPDNDQDGVEDRTDQCPAEAEDRDGFEDENGCPDPDNDQDGVLDAEDQCKTEPEDRDNFEDENGCPDLDNDQDGVLDAADQCPQTPGRAEDNGCPRTIRLEGSQIVILERIEFRTGNAKLLSKSFPVLEDVRTVLNSSPQIKKVRIEGHTDDRGNDEKNMTLSQRRAEAVKQWLVEHGIDAGRLEAQGLGETRPLDSNKTRQGRQRNRRVEFHIVDPASPSPTSTTPGSSSPGVTPSRPGVPDAGTQGSSTPAAP